MKKVPPEQWYHSMQIGQQHYQQGRFREAERAFLAATRIAPSQAEGWVNLGATLAQLGQLERAASFLEKSIVLNPRLLPAVMLLGDVLRLMGNWETMVTVYRQAVALERTPVALNKLASALRIIGQGSEAEALYKEALQKESEYSMAKVNLATLQLELERFDEAKRQLGELQTQKLSAEERNEVETASLALEQFLFTQPKLNDAVNREDWQQLRVALNGIPEEMLGVDEEVLSGIRSYILSARELPPIEEKVAVSLVDEWPLIEVLFMIPYVESVHEYQRVKSELEQGGALSGDLLESVAMQLVVQAARDGYRDLGDPVGLETQLRYWHWLATRDLEGFMPGQFKMTHNLTRADLSKRRAQPHLVIGTLRTAFEEVYSRLLPGLYRGLVAMMAISDIHAFADGNGRLGLVLLNRELEAVGQMPVLFTTDMGIKGKLGAAMAQVRRSGGDISRLLPVVEEAQRFSRHFCENLEERTSPSY